MNTKNRPRPNEVRLITIEEDGNAFKGPRKPKIRLSGNWLQAAGFSPGQKVQVTFIDTGIMQLQIQQSQQIPVSASEGLYPTTGALEKRKTSSRIPAGG